MTDTDHPTIQRPDNSEETTMPTHPLATMRGVRTIVAPHARPRRQSTYRPAIETVKDHGLIMQRNFYLWWNASTEESMSDGLGFYQSMHRFIASLARVPSLSVAQCAGIVAAYSVRTSWDENRYHAARLCLYGPDASGASDNSNGALPLNNAKAVAIYNGAHWSDTLQVNTTRGYAPKTRSFCRNGIDPDHDGAATIDRHILMAMLPHLTRAEQEDTLARPGMYQLLAGMIRRIARDLSFEYNAKLTTNDVQAVVWCTIRKAESPYEQTLADDLSPEEVIAQYRPDTLDF